MKEGHEGAGLLAGPVVHEDPTPEECAPEGLHPMERTHAGTVLKNPQPMGKPHIVEVC